MSARLAAQQARSALLECQRRVLEHIANGTPLREILATLVVLVEEQIPGLRCALLLADAEQTRLHFVAAPHVPEDYKRNIEPYLVIAPNMGSCGTAAFLRQPVHTRDTGSDPLWAGCGEIAVRNGLRAIWSTPILGDDNRVLGTFAMYYGEPRLPDAEHIQLIDLATQMARIAIQSKQDEERLRASEQRYRLIAEHARDLIALLDPRGRRLYTSPSYAALYGEEAASLEGQIAFNVVHPEDRARIEAEFREMIASGVGRRLEFRVVSRHKGVCNLQMELSPILDSSGRIASVLGVGRDISEERRTQEALREAQRASEREFRDVIENIPVIAWTTRPDGPGEFTNRSWEEYTGQTAAQSQGWGWVAKVHPEDVERHLAAWKEAVASGGPFESEARYRRTDGTYRSFLTRGVPRRDEHGQIQRWYGVLVDIEDRKRADAAVRENEQLFKFVLETLPVGVVVQDPAGDIVLANAATRRVWGGELIVSGAERRARSKGFWHSSGKQLSPGEWASVVAVSEGREVMNQLIDIEAFDGRRKTIENSAAPIRNSDGAIVGAVVVNHEVTDRVRAEEALHESAQRLKHLSRRLLALQEEERRHLSRELHDRLGETLTALSINLSMLKDGVQGDARAKARVEDSAALVKSTAATVENIVADLRPPMLDDHGLAAALTWYGRQFAARTGVAVSVQAPEPDERVAPEMSIALFRIVQEALNNVTKHARAKNVAITLARANRELVLSIADDGVGLARAAQAPDRLRPGLGLVTMRERAQALGGCFTIEPLAEGAGTRVTVKVPA